jgi:hypothetical protein
LICVCCVGYVVAVCALCCVAVRCVYSAHVALCAMWVHVRWVLAILAYIGPLRLQYGFQSSYLYKKNWKLSI